MIFDDLSLVKVEKADLTNTTATVNDGNNSLFFAIISPAVGVKTNITLQECDTQAGVYTNVPAEQVIGEADFAAADVNTVKKIGYAGGKKYVKLLASAAAVDFVAVAVKGRNRHI